MEDENSRCNKLSAIAVKQLKRPGRYGDGRGLYLQIAKGGSRQWVFRYQIAGRPRLMGLGSAVDFTLKEARERAKDYRKLLADGIDPIEHRNRARTGERLEAEEAQRREKEALAKRVTFRQAADRYIETHRETWTNPKHADQWPNSLERHVYPVLGDVAVGDIEKHHVLDVLRPIWTTKRETARRVRARIEAVLNWGIAQGLRGSDNPAELRLLRELLPRHNKAREVRHHPAMKWQDVPAFVQTLRALGSISATALEFTIATASRTGEVIHAEWPEIDLERRIWTIPAERMKARKPHEVPLSHRAVEILTGLPREHGNVHVFLGGRPRNGLSQMAMLECLRGITEGQGLTVHGFRSSFRDWASESDERYPHAVVEKALAHKIPDAVERAYHRTELLEQRRRLMRDWAAFVGSPADEADQLAEREAKRIAAREPDDDADIVIPFPLRQRA